MRAWRSLGIRIVSLLVVLTVWELYGRSVSPILFTYPTAIGQAFVDVVGSGELWGYLNQSLKVLAIALLLSVGIAAMRGPGVNSAVIAIAIVYVPLFARVMRGPVLAEREKEYVEAIRALGATRWVVALKHVLPNVVSPFVVQGTVALSQAILIEASLSYLGLSAQPPTPSWGNMLNEGRTYLETAPWISVFPGIAIMITVLAFNLLGDGLRDVLDPSAQ